jgi:DivIVA domain-containing protein
MDMTPQEIAGTTFRVVKRGFDPEEVRLFQLDAARSLEAAQSHAALMEQRARAAVAKAQGLAASVAAAPEPAAATAAVTSSAVAMRADDAQTISRTLLLAQSTADRTVAEAEQQAATIRAAAERDAASILDEARRTSAALVADARAEARRAGEAERTRINNEVLALLARLDFLRGDVDAMEQHASAQREQILHVAESLRTLAESPSLGLGDLKPPVLSTAADMPRLDPSVHEPQLFDDETEASAASIVADASPPTLVADTPPAPIGRHDATPGVGSPLLPPVDIALSELPTGEIPAIRPTSGPVVVPDLDVDWDDAPAARDADLRIIGEA